MKTKKDNMVTLDQFKDKHYGKRGTAKRNQLEPGYENFNPWGLTWKGVDNDWPVGLGNKINNSLSWVMDMDCIGNTHSQELGAIAYGDRRHTDNII